MLLFTPKTSKSKVSIKGKKPETVLTTSLLGISRLRIGTDGDGITTLVAFHGCTLGCRYCLNPQCKKPNAKVRKVTPEEVIEELKNDEIYFVATKGGVTFGGGEPFLNNLFISV